MEVLKDIWIIILMCAFIMSASDILPKRNFIRRIFTVSKQHQWGAAFIGGVAYLLFEDEWTKWHIGVLVAALFVIINNGWRLRSYIPWYPKSIQSGSRADLKLFSLNVRQKNNGYTRALKAIEDADAHILALTETNGEWAEALSPLDHSHPYSIKVPLENTYGMILYSKHEILRHEVRYMVSDEIPSIHAELDVNGMRIYLMLIHPEPPLDFKRLKEKDLEIIHVGFEAEEVDCPVILCGDLNDVGWSYASQHLCEQTKLEDPRVGRGFFNSYNAFVPIFRYPIDHFFISPQLKVVEMKVRPKCGSDHFPVTLTLELPEKKEPE